MHSEQLPDGPCSPSENTASGKCQCWSPEAVVADTTTSRLLHIQGWASGYSFLIDTGAEVSLIPASPADHLAAILFTNSAPLVAANGMEIKNYSSGLPLKFSSKCFQGSFIIADILHDNGLLINLGGEHLVHSAMSANITAPSIMCLPIPLDVTKPS